MLISEKRADLRIKEIEEKRQKLSIDEKMTELQIKESEAELLEIKIIREKIILLRDLGYSDDEIRDLTKSLLNPAKKLLKSSEANNIRLI